MPKFASAKPYGTYHDHGGEGRRDDLPEVKAALEASAEEVLHHLFPGGVRRGHEFVAADRSGGRGESFKVSLAPGKVGTGEDFATGEVVSDLLDCWCYARFGERARYSRHFAEVVEEARAWIGMPDAWKRKPPTDRSVGREPRPEPTARWTYVDRLGEPEVVVTRYDMPDGRKEFSNHLPKLGRWAMPAADRPPYRADMLASLGEGAWIVLVEGEKCADALVAAGVANATTLLGGSGTDLDKVDWSFFRGRRVIVWPDADRAGAGFAAAASERLLAEGARSTHLLQVPDGVAEGWDAADAVAEGRDVVAMVAQAGTRGAPPPSPERRTIDLDAWTLAAFSPEPKPIAWTVEDLIPRGVAGLMVAKGDLGKGFLSLWLAIQIARAKHASGRFGELPTFLGKPVRATGTAVIFAAEDDKDEFERRLAAMFPADRWGELGTRLRIVPLPNAGGPMILFAPGPGGSGAQATREWEMVEERLIAIDDLVLASFDPLAAFCSCDVNADPAAAAYVTAKFARLATVTGSTVLVPAHMRKGEIGNAEDARENIRGTTALVDGVRFAMAFWLAPETEGREIAREVGRDWSPGLVAYGAMVKSNAPADRKLRTLVRAENSGLLEDVSARMQGTEIQARHDDKDLLVKVLAHAAGEGHPFMVSGNHGLEENKHKLPHALRLIPREKLQRLAKELLADGRLRTTRFPGQTTDRWLDVPGGAIEAGRVQGLGEGSYSYPEG